MLEPDGPRRNLARHLDPARKGAQQRLHRPLVARYGVQGDPQPGGQRSFDRIPCRTAGDVSTVQDVDGQPSDDQEVNRRFGDEPDIIGHP